MRTDRIKVIAIVILSILLVICAIVFATAVGRETTKDINELPTPEIPNQQPVSQQADDVEVGGDSLSKSKIGWGQGVELNDKNQPVAAINAQEQYGHLGGQFIFPEDENAMYLTFDLGYENGYTEPILDALDARGIKATFFVTIDYVNEAPGILQRIIDNGHTVANHTMKHPSIPDVSDEKVTEQIMGLHDCIEQNFGYSMTLFRYPKGEFSEYSLDFITNLGYKSIFWSYAYVDWIVGDQPSCDTAMTKLTNAMHPGAIYMLHAVSSTNAAIMGDFVDRAIQEGYSFGLIDEKLGLVETVEPPII